MLMMKTMGTGLTMNGKEIHIHLQLCSIQQNCNLFESASYHQAMIGQSHEILPPYWSMCVGVRRSEKHQKLILILRIVRKLEYV